MPCFACLFEAKSIQNLVPCSGRLRHIVGASRLIGSAGTETEGHPDLRRNPDHRSHRVTDG